MFACGEWCPAHIVLVFLLFLFGFYSLSCVNCVASFHFVLPLQYSLSFIDISNIICKVNVILFVLYHNCGLRSIQKLYCVCVCVCVCVHSGVQHTLYCVLLCFISYCVPYISPATCVWSSLLVKNKYVVPYFLHSDK